MSRSVTLLTAAVTFLIGGLCVLGAQGQIALHYLLPSAGGVTRQTAIFGPAVAATVVAAVVWFVTAVWLVLVILRRSARWMILTVFGLLTVDLVVLLVVAGLSRPTF